jgi:NAD(P)-dependent dehydrogenase (short-subunit alcohol dehydrogenase family)
MYERLDLWRGKVAAILPVPAVEPAHTGFVERTVHGAGDVVSTVRRQVRETVVGAREHVADGTAQAKQHAAGLYSRAVDPTPLAGVRPGAVAATIAGCLAVGSGAGYCITEGVGPIPMLGRTQAAQHEPRKSHYRPKRARAAQATTSTIAAPAPTPAPAPAPPTQGAGAVTSYGISKTALNALTTKLAAELEETGILVNSVCPGLTATAPGIETMGARPVADGAASVIWAVQLPAGGPTGGVFSDGERLPW